MHSRVQLPKRMACPLIYRPTSLCALWLVRWMTSAPSREMQRISATKIDPPQTVFGRRVGGPGSCETRKRDMCRAYVHTHSSDLVFKRRGSSPPKTPPGTLKPLTKMYHKVKTGNSNETEHFDTKASIYRLIMSITRLIQNVFEHAHFEMP